MARDHARIRLDIWTDDEWRDLTPGAQWLYVHLLTNHSLSFAGVADWRPARITGMATGLTADTVADLAMELQAGAFVLIDTTTEEALIRSFVKHDGLMRSPNMAKALARDHGAISSPTLRAVLVGQLKHLERQQPEMKGWPEVAEVLEKRSMTFAEGLANLSGEGSDKGSGKGSDKGSPEGMPVGSRTPLLPSSLPPLLPPSATQAADQDPSPAATAAGFDEFWDAYPRKEARRKAVTAYSSALKRADVASIVAGAQRYRSDPNRDASYTALPTTWLNGDRWADDPLPPRPAEQGNVRQRVRTNTDWMAGT